MTDYKQLCAELLDALESYMDWSNAEELKSRARTALAEPEPEGPTDEELFATAEAYAEDNGLIGLHNAPDFARAVLARWGNHPESPDSSLQPVPEGPTDEPMTEEQLDALRHLIQQEINVAQIDGMEHGVWGWADKMLEEGWQDFKDSFKSI